MTNPDRTETNIIITSPINPALISPGQRRQMFPREVRFEQALNNCQIVDKDAVADEIAQTLMTMNKVYRIVGLSRRTRGSKIRQYEQEILGLPPKQQLLAIQQLQKNMRVVER